MHMRYYGNSMQNSVSNSVQNPRHIYEEKTKAALPPAKTETKKSFFEGFFNKFSADDLILIAIIFILLQEDDIDIILIFILAYIFFA